MLLQMTYQFVQSCMINLLNECLSLGFKDTGGYGGCEDFHITRKIALGKGKGHIHIDRLEVQQPEHTEVHRCIEARNNFQNV